MYRSVCVYMYVCIVQQRLHTKYIVALKKIGHKIKNANQERAEGRL